MPRNHSEVEADVFRTCTQCTGVGVQFVGGKVGCGKSPVVDCVILKVLKTVYDEEQGGQVSATAELATCDWVAANAGVTGEPVFTKRGK